jgi:hypothetical protein
MSELVGGNKSLLSKVLKKNTIWAMEVGKSHFVFINILKWG